MSTRGSRPRVETRHAAGPREATPLLLRLLLRLLQLLPLLSLRQLQLQLQLLLLLRPLRLGLLLGPQVVPRRHG